MFCKYCGNTLEDNATFCYKCGKLTARGEQLQAQQAQTPAAPSYYGASQAKEPVSVGGWIGRSLIPCIPIVGGLIYLIMLFVWSGDTTKEDSFRNWAKAQLIVTAIVIGLMILVVVISIIAGASIIDAITDVF